MTNIKEMRTKAKQLKPIINIGKNGLTPEMIDHIKLLLKKKKLIKIKLLKSYMESSEKKEAAKLLCEKTGGELVEQVGFVVVIYKR